MSIPDGMKEWLSRATPEQIIKMVDAMDNQRIELEKRVNSLDHAKYILASRCRHLELDLEFERRESRFYSDEADRLNKKLELYESSPPSFGNVIHPRKPYYVEGTDIVLTGMLAMLVRSVSISHSLDGSFYAVQILIQVPSSAGEENPGIVFISNGRVGFTLPSSILLNSDEFKHRFFNSLHSMFLHEVREGMRNTDMVCFSDPHPEVKK